MYPPGKNGKRKSTTIDKNRKNRIMTQYDNLLDRNIVGEKLRPEGSSTRKRSRSTRSGGWLVGTQSTSTGTRPPRLGRRRISQGNTNVITQDKESSSTTMKIGGQESLQEELGDKVRITKLQRADLPTYDKDNKENEYWARNYVAGDQGKLSQMTIFMHGYEDGQQDKVKEDTTMYSYKEGQQDKDTGDTIEAM